MKIIYDLEEIEEELYDKIDPYEVSGVMLILKGLPEIEPPEEFECCHGCKEYDQRRHCCHRWAKVIANKVADLISRQAAIDALDALSYHADKYVIESGEHAFCTGIAVAIRQLELVPSINPKKTYDPSHPFADDVMMCEKDRADDEV